MDHWVLSCPGRRVDFGQLILILRRDAPAQGGTTLITQALASGAETTFRPPIWWLGIGLLLLAALTALTMHLFRNKGSKRFRALALTVVVALGVPVMMLDRIVVSGTGIEETGGVVTTRGFHYADVEYIHVTTRPGARARTVTVWEVHYKPDSALGLASAGRVEDIHIGTLWGVNSDTIMGLLKASGVQFR